MMAVHHPGKSQGIMDLQQLIKQMVKATLQNAAVGSAGIRVYDAGRIRFTEGGGIVIEGAGFIDGSGEFTWTGTWGFTGDGEITGDTVMSGDVSITKDLDVQATTRLRGQTTLEDDLTVTADGKILVGDMTIDPSAGQGRITFANGAQIRAHDGGATLSYGGSHVTVNGTRILLTGGGTSLQMVGGRYYFNPASTLKVSGTGLPPGVLFIGVDGVLSEAL